MTAGDIFIENIRKTAEKHDMFTGTDVVFTALSGGADSVALHLALHRLSCEYGFRLKAVHVNHNIRGEEALRDAEFCRNLCGRLGTEFVLVSRDVPKYAEESRLSVEEAARNIRYEAFASLCGGNNYKIATAHTLNDSAETVLFNLSRGTGIKGLTGIPPVRDYLIRPIINCTRAEVEAFLKELGQDFVTDSTNLSDDYTRNKIRHRLIPLMDEIHGGFHGNIRRMTENLSDDCDYLETAALNAAADRLTDLHPAIRRRVIINIFKQHKIEVNAERIAAAEKLVISGGRLHISGDVYAFAKDGFLSLRTVNTGCVIFEESPLETGKNPFLCDKIVTIRKYQGEIFHADDIINKKFTENLFDCDKIQGRLFLRNRRDGDRYQRIGRNFTSSLKKLMNASYPLEERDFIPVITDENGIVWVEGFGAADRVKIDENTRNYYSISVCHHNST